MRRGTDLGANNEDVKNRLYNAYGMAAPYLVLRAGINKSKDVDKHILAELYDENEKKEAAEMHIPERRKYRNRAIFLTIGGGSAMATGFLYAAFTAMMNMENVNHATHPQYDAEKAALQRRRAYRISGGLFVGGLPLLTAGCNYFKKSNKRVYIAVNPLVVDDGYHFALVP